MKDIVKKIDFYAEVAAREGLRSVWSVYEVDNFEEVPFPNAEVLVYSNHWGSKQVDTDIPKNSTWLDIWKACESLIKKSGDNHHIYIEFIKNVGSDHLELRTGS